MSDTNKILEKGPDYLRKQMELETETKEGMSAVERLAASKVKYVKSQKVVNSTQEPAISLGSASVSSTGSSNRSSNRGRKVFSASKKSADASGGSESDPPGQVRRTSSKKRPDSLLIYRQKCELLKGSAYRRRHHVNRKQQKQKSSMKSEPLPEAQKECESKGHEEETTTPEGDAKECQVNVVVSQTRDAQQNAPENTDPGTNTTDDRGSKPKPQGLLAVPEFRRTGKGVSRSHSDISSRYSKNFADFDAFFKYCGLDGEIIESLGKENFSARSDDLTKNIRSISVSTSEDCFSRNSEDSDGLQEEELHEKIHQGTSVIERNARIIKWLYSCKNAKETGKKLRDLD